ncbi:hypothetical protein EKG83_10460 [Saccharothrix syringae]|uniref:Uncharacterized protein n=2 Tax=Saccharothrix syringae TaxID=103733 RepID=A0A5Q0HE87_SACSY|nr:hypothetical protein EKG83_10460 [Saccharothrix syringae]
MGDGREWTLSHTRAAGDREAARAEALRLAREYAPAYPWSLRSRKVLRVSEDSYVVIANGLTSTFHFRVQVGELLD